MKIKKERLTSILSLLIIICAISYNIYKHIHKKEVYILRHSVLKDEIKDVPIKAQVEQSVLISDTAITREKISNLLILLYDKASKRKGFKYHSTPINIYIYAYTSKEKLEYGPPQSIGVLSKHSFNTKPDIHINKTQLNSLKFKPIEKFGLSHKVRLEIWKKTIEKQRRSYKDAEDKYPLDNLSTINDDQIKHLKFQHKILKEHYKELAKEYNIETRIVDSISFEGVAKGWPPPKH